jgi:Serine carboxypeptidase S28
MDYGASLATWFSQKYPHLVSGIWASGGRIHSILEANQPVEIVEKVLQKFGSAECWNRTENAFRQIEEMIANNQSTILERTFRLCFPLPYTRDPIDLWIFFQVLGSYYYAYAEVLDVEWFEELTCGQLLNAPVEEDFEALAYALGFWTIPFPLCYPISFDRTFRFFNDIQHGGEEADQRTLLYSYCTELGYFYHSGEGQTVFGPNFPVDLLTEACQAVFG